MDPPKKPKLKQSLLGALFEKQRTNAAETVTRERDEQTECNTGWLQIVIATSHSLYCLSVFAYVYVD